MARASPKPSHAGALGVRRARRLPRAPRWLQLWALAGSTACAPLFGQRPPPPATVPADALDARARAEPAVFMPPSLAGEDDEVVRIVVGPITCSGTLIADDQVLTAHHCVARRGADASGDVEPKSIQIELGGEYLPWGDVGVRAVLAPNCGYAGGDGDLAVLVLNRKLHGIATRKPRLDDPPLSHESIEPIGFGRCALSGDGVRRRRRLPASVESVADGHFQARVPICPGDSGGPALSGDSAEIVGVVSQSAMDGDEQTPDRSEFVRLDRWRSLFANAELVAKGTSPSELPPVECPHPPTKSRRR